MKEAINSLFPRALWAAYPIALSCSNPCRLDSKLNRLYFDEMKETPKPSTSGGVEGGFGLSEGTSCRSFS